VAPSETKLVVAKLHQAAELLPAFDLDVWLVYVRETSLTRDPALDLIYPHALTWETAFFVTRQGQSIAVMGRYDAGTARAMQAFNEVVAYDQSIRPAFIQVVRRLAPRRLAVNFSLNDPACDGLTHGLKQNLDSLLTEAGFDPAGLISAESFLGSLRGRKTPQEVQHIRRAIATTEELLQAIEGHLRPGVTERQIADTLHQWMRRRQLDAAWSWEGDPIVNTGPEAEVGHGLPTDRSIELGHLVHIDFGVRQDGFCADLQRTWYVLRPEEDQAPPDLQQAWSAVQQALAAGAATLVPGAMGWEVDQAARTSLVHAGYPEYLHAFGHHLGRMAHDGSTVLGPRWERYGQSPFGKVEAGNVFAIEPGVVLPGFGPVYVEEDVLVSADGLVWLSRPQTEIRLIRP
jgi:Xaa-Pro aminopeptidase